METVLIMLLLPFSVVAGRPADPSPGPWMSKEDGRNLECTRLSQAQAHQLHPGVIPEPPPRGPAGITDALVCTRRMLPYGERASRDEVLLSSLTQSVGEITEVASALEPDPTVWHVDAFYPDPRVAEKISVAAKTTLAEHGSKVSDRTPLLAAGDISVLARLPAKDAYPLACARYFREHVLGEREAFLGLMIVDARETVLHAGVCARGEWKWLR